MPVSHKEVSCGFTEALLEGGENLIHGNFQHGGSGLQFAVVGGGGFGIAQDKVLGRIGSIASRIGGAEDGDGPRAKCDGEVKRTGVSSDDTLSALEQSHQLGEFAVVSDGCRVAAGGLHGSGEAFFAWTVIDDAAHAQILPDFAAKLTEALRRPTLGAPAATRTQNDIAIDASSVEVGTDPLALGGIHL